MGWFDDHKPAIVMLVLQFTYAGVTLSTRAALLQGMSPRVFVFYRQAIATLVITPIAYLARRKSTMCSMGLRSFALIFFTTLIGVTVNQNIYFEGVYLASSTMGSAMGNLIPAITFVMASIIGLEKVNIRRLRSVAKIVGTVLCVSGAISMALLKGPKLLNAELLPITTSIFGSGGDNWLLGCLFIFGSCCCWSVWLILQVPVSACYPDHLCLSAWMCFMATIQSAIVVVFTEKDTQAWNLNSYLQLACCFYSGIIGSGLSFFVQAWCISHRGPLFSAMFNPLCTVVVTIFASIFLHEEIYTGSLVGGVCVVSGLYAVLWGKAKDVEEFKVVVHKDHLKLANDGTRIHQSSHKIDLEEPLLSDQPINKT